MHMWKNPNWFEIGMDAWALAAESNLVIVQRIGAIAIGGPAAAKEAQRMINEKITANMTLGIDIATGKYGISPESILSGSIAHYSKTVVTNRVRLAS